VSYLIISGACSIRVSLSLEVNKSMDRIFCHSKNRIWRVQALNEEQIEAPKVPGGMTGGVEYEAMEYCVRPLLDVSSCRHTDWYHRLRISASSIALRDRARRAWMPFSSILICS
jgi:hypothetical protein